MAASRPLRPYVPALRPRLTRALRVDVQDGMAQRNAEIAADRRIAFRVGIHLGDVVVDGADL